MAWQPTAAIGLGKACEVDDHGGHVEFEVRATGLGTDMNGDPTCPDEEWEQARPLVLAMRRYVAGQLARLAVALSEPMTIAAIGHGCFRGPVQTDAESSNQRVADTIGHYRDRLRRGHEGPMLLRNYQGYLSWPDSCYLYAVGVVTPTDRRCDLTDGPMVSLVIPKGDVTWWREQVKTLLNEIRSDS